MGLDMDGTPAENLKAIVECRKDGLEGNTQKLLQKQG